MDLFNLAAKLTLDKSDYEKGVDDAEKEGRGLGEKLKGALGTVGKIAGGAVAGAATAIAGLTKASVDAYGNYQQLVGGVETLFGTGGMSLEEYAKSAGKSVDEVRDEYNKLKKAENTVLRNSDKAFKTAGLNANAYMEQATSTAAALIGSLGGDTAKAAELADQAIIDMADNSNKMGTSMESIQNAYSGFAKGNFQMLDNLKLGYGGTKDEMQRLLDKAGEISGYKYDISSYADIVEAIHVVQTEMGITGTTAKEAGDTIQGSGLAMKAAWENLVTSFGRGGEETSAAMHGLVDSIGAYLENLLPAVKDILGNIGNAITEIVPIIMDKLPGIISDLLPGLLTGALSIVTSIIEKVPDLLAAIFSAVKQAVFSVDWLSVGLSIWDAIKSAFINIWQWATDTFNSAKDAISQIDWESVGQTIWDFVVGVFSDVSTWYSETFDAVKTAIEEIDWAAVGSVLWDGIVGIFTGIASYYKALFELAKTFISMVDWKALGKTIWDGIVNKVKAIATWGKERFDDLVAKVKEIDWVQLGTDIFNWIAKKLGTVNTWLKAIFNFAIARVKEIDWVQLGTDIFNWIAEKLSTVGAWLKALFNFGVSKIKEIDWVQLGIDLLASIGEGIGSVAEWLGGLFDDAVAEIKEIDWLQLGTDILNGIWDGLCDLGDWLADLFDFSGIKIKWPHLTVTRYTSIPVIGDVPTGFRVDWYKKAMQTPYMFTQPTIFGAGEAGDEIMYGRSNLMRDIRQAVGGAAGANVTFNVYAAEGQDPEEIARAVQRQFAEWEDQRRAAYV